jgi:hypothetical protein
LRDAASAMTDREKEWGIKASRYLKAELKRAGVGYKELAERLAAHGMEETETSITGKLARGSFPVSFFLACLTVLGIAAVALGDL